LFSPRNTPFVPAVPAISSPEEIAATVSRWQSVHQPVMPSVAAAPVVPQQSSPIETAPHLKEAGANWFAEVRKQDVADQDEVRQRVQQILNRAAPTG
jgi:hypothetical protein